MRVRAILRYGAQLTTAAGLTLAAAGALDAQACSTGAASHAHQHRL
jgi:hypothetical protein